MVSRILVSDQTILLWVQVSLGGGAADYGAGVAAAVRALEARKLRKLTMCTCAVEEHPDMLHAWLVPALRTALL